MTGFSAAFRDGWRRALTFNGRSSRSQYWWWKLSAALMVWLPALLFGLVYNPADGVNSQFERDVENQAPALMAVAGIYITLVLAVCVASLSLLVRRFHDVGLSGWWVGGLLMVLTLTSALTRGSASLAYVAIGIQIPIGLWVLTVTLLKGKNEGNRFGQVDLAPETSQLRAISDEFGEPPTELRNGNLWIAAVIVFVGAIIVFALAQTASDKFGAPSSAENASTEKIPAPSSVADSAPCAVFWDGWAFRRGRPEDLDTYAKPLGDLLPGIHAIGKLARQMETSDAAKPIYRRADHWCAARA